MKVTPTAIPEVLILEPQVFGDDRGFFFESYNARKFEQLSEPHRKMVFELVLALLRLEDKQ